MNMLRSSSCFIRRSVVVSAALFATFAIGSESENAVQLELQARLFHSGSGSFSEDVLSSGGADLVNVIASENPSTATLVIAAVKLAPNAVLRSDAKLRLLAREKLGKGRGERVMVDSRLAVGPVSRGGKTNLGFWLQGTGCHELLLEAKLIIPGQAAPIVAEATLPFVCGE